MCEKKRETNSTTNVSLFLLGVFSIPDLHRFQFTKPIRNGNCTKSRHLIRKKKKIQFISFVSCSSPHPSLIVEFFHICPTIHSMLMLQTETQHKQTPNEFPLKLEHEITKEIPSSTKSNFEPSEKLK